MKNPDARSESAEILWVAFQSVAVFLAVDTVLVLGVAALVTRRTDSTETTALCLTVAGLVASAAAIAYAYSEGVRWPEFRAIHDERWGRVIAVVVACGSTALVASIGAGALAKTPGPTGDAVSFSSWLSPNSIRRVLVITATPFVEELLFRGTVLKALLHRLAPLAAIVASAAIFAAYHLSLANLPFVFVLGALTGYAYHRTHSLIPCIAGHAAWNLMVAVAVPVAAGEVEWGVRAAAVTLSGLGVSALALWYLRVSTGEAA